MSNPFHHSVSSVKKWGGEISDYSDIHHWFDDTKAHFGDFRHRALKHHSLGIFQCEEKFGRTITLSTGRVIPTRWVAEQHVIEDCGRIPSVQDWLIQIEPKPWMNQPIKIEKEMEVFVKEIL